MTDLRDDRALQYTGVLFAIALVVHGADHMRRGFDVLSGEVFWAGNLQSVGAVIVLFLVFTHHRWAPGAAIVIGFASAFGFAVVHLLPEWGVFSDALPGADIGAGVTAFSWFAALFEIGADLAFGWAGLHVLRHRRERAVPEPVA